MKKILSFLLLSFAVECFSLTGWETYTNHSHIYGLTAANGEIYTATWGGLAVYDDTTLDLKEKYTIIDGLSDNDITCVTYGTSSQTLYLGTRNGGVNRFFGGAFLPPLNELLGVLSAHITGLVADDSLLFVATPEGISVFKDSEDFPYPLLKNSFTTQEGLSNNNISALCLASDSGRLYLGSSTGIDYIEVDSLLLNVYSAWKHVNKFGLGNLGINSISEENGILAIGTRAGLFVGNGDFTSGEIIGSTKTMSIFPVLVRDGHVYYSQGYWDDTNLQVVTAGEIALYEYSNGEIMNHEDELSTSITSLSYLGDKLCIGFWGDAFAVANDGGEWKRPHDASISANPITALEADKNGNIWVCNGYRGGTASAFGTKGVSVFDGIQWKNYDYDNSGICSNSIYDLTSDEQGRIWMGAWDRGVTGWRDGISVYSPQTEAWVDITRNNGLLNNTISMIECDPNNNVWAYSSGAGVNIINSDFAVIASVTMPQNLIDSNETFANDIAFGKDAVYLATSDKGLCILPIDVTTEDLHAIVDADPRWYKPSVSDLRSGAVYSVATRMNAWGDEEVWVASANGLYLFNNNLTDDTYDRWYKYGTYIKRYVYGSGTWQEELRYYADEVRLFNSNVTVPQTLYIDPFNRVWIGSRDYGITVYDAETDRFSVYEKKDYPLLSNYITSFAHDTFGGYLYIGTPSGLNAVPIGKSGKTSNEPLSHVVVYPNPFNPQVSPLVYIQNFIDGNFGDFPTGQAQCRIYDLAGVLVAELKEQYRDVISTRFEWNGKNDKGKECANGMYFYVVADAKGNLKRGKIALIRK